VDLCSFKKELEGKFEERSFSLAHSLFRTQAPAMKQLGSFFLRRVVCSLISAQHLPPAHLLVPKVSLE